MEKRLQKLGQVVLRSASLAERTWSGVQQQTQGVGKNVAQKLGTAAVETASTIGLYAQHAGDLVQQTLKTVIYHQTAKTLVVQVKDLGNQVVDMTASGVSKVGEQVQHGVKKLDQSLQDYHLEIKEKTEAVSMGLGIAAGVATGAAIIGPPAVVAAAPLIGAAATVSGAVAGGAYFHSKWRDYKATKVENQAFDATSDTKNTCPPHTPDTATSSDSI